MFTNRDLMCVKIKMECIPFLLDRFASAMERYRPSNSCARYPRPCEGHKWGAATKAASARSNDWDEVTVF